MADYTVVVQGKLQGFDELDRYEQKIKSLDGTKIKIELDDSGIGTILSSSSSDNKQYQNIGKNISQNISKGIKSVKINNPIDFSKQQQEYRNKIKDYQRQMMSGISGLGEKDAAKDANAYFKVEQKAAEKANKEAAKQQAKALAQTKKNQSAMDKVQARQKFNELKSNAVNKNAHYNNLVDSGKELKTRLEQEQVERQKAQIKAAKANLQQIQKVQSSTSHTQFQQYWGSLRDKATNKNSRYNDLVDSGKEYIAKLKAQQMEASKYAEQQAATIAKIQQRSQSGEFEFRNAKNDSFLSNYVGQNSEALTRARTQIEEIRSLQKELQTGVYESGDNKGLQIIPDDQITKAGQLDEKISQLNNTMKQVRVESSKTLEEGVALRSANNIASYMEANSKAIKKYGSDLKALEQEYRSITTYAEKADLDRRFNNLKSQISAEGLTGKSFFSDFKRAFTQIAQFTGIYATLQNVMLEAPSQMINAVKDVDTAMTNLYKVTDETANRYDKFMSDAGTSSQKLGRSMSSYIEQTANWSKLGYSLNESEQLSKLSSIYANVGEVNDDTAVSDMVTAMKAFDIQASDAQQIIDQLNILGNEFATTSADLGAGLSKSAASLANGGADLSESLAMLTGGAEITQNAEEFGNFLKVAIMRIKGMKGSLEELGEEVDPTVDSISKVQTQILNLTKGKVNIFDSNKNFRDYYKIMEDISSVYDSLDPTNRASLDEILFGKQRANQGAALIKAFQSGQVQKAYQAALNSEGSAQQEQDRWLESIEAKEQQFKAAMQNFSTSFINSNIFKALIDSGTTVLNVLTQIIDKFGALQTAIASVTAFKGITSFVKNFDNLAIRLEELKIFSPIIFNWSIIAKNVA